MISKLTLPFKLLAFCVYVSVLHSCKSDAQPSIESTEIDLNSLEIDYDVSGRGGNIIDDFYGKVLDQNPDLKRIDDELESIQETGKDASNEFLKFNSKSERYYGFTDNYTKNLTDSVLKSKIRQLIKKSSERYRSDSKELVEINKLLHNNNLSIEEYHTVLKIVTTLPAIEEFQKTRKPNIDDLKHAEMSQKKVIDKLNKTTNDLMKD